MSPSSDVSALVTLAEERIAKGSKSFAGASKLFDAETRASAVMLYAWCRHCDDEIDGQVLGFAQAPTRRPPTEVLAELRGKTRDATAGTAQDPIFQCLQLVLAKHAIPAVHPFDLIRGMEMDVDFEAGRRAYRIEADLIEYCYHVAGVVGVMMAMIMGARDRAVLLRASDLGIAFQLTNIVRDIVADAGAGRVYIPEDMLSRAGLSASALADPKHRQVLFGIARTLLREAERYYRSAHHGLPHLPVRSAWAVGTARRVYRDIGTLVEARGAAAWDERTSTSRARKLAGVVLAAGDTLASRFTRSSLSDDDRAGLYVPASLAAI